MSTILLRKNSYDITRRMQFALAVSIVTALTLSLMPMRVLAADGDLDTSFGVNGKVVTDFFGGIDQITSVVLQPDGKIVVAGYATSGATEADFALARYDASGSLDPAFGTNGKVTTAFSSAFDAANAIALQPDGKI
ncbi:MAG TPA: delta-60 repeat domain-containing protein, partial [Blastocatellia bacterium]